MGDRQFDDLTKAVASGQSRRRIVKVVVGGVISGASGVLGLRRGSAPAAATTTTTTTKAPPPTTTTTTTRTTVAPPPTTTTTTTRPPAFEGCTPGFWKNHPEAWVGFTTGQTLESVFDVPDALGLDNATLLQALKFGGGPGVLGAAQILLRAAVAALLNAAHPDVDYTLTVAQVIQRVNAALASGDRQTILNLATELDRLNNLGCPL